MWLWALERSAAPACALPGALLFYSYKTSSKKLLADDGVWTSRRSRRTAAWPLGTSRGPAQPSNAAFETECAWAWRALDARRDVFVEDEEGHVGRCLVPWLSTCACGRLRASKRRTPHAWRTLLEDCALDEAADAGGGRARLDAALALVAKRLGPDDTARTKRFLDAGELLEDYALDEAAGTGGARGAPRRGAGAQSRSGWAPTTRRARRGSWTRSTSRRARACC